MKKIMNAPENYTDDMLRGIYAAHADCVKCTADDLRCYCIAKKHPGKVAIITGGGTGHLPLFLGSSRLRPSRSSTSPRKWKTAPACSICTATTPAIS